MDMQHGQGRRWLKAGVHGAVIGIEVQAGDAVAAGQVLLVQEAMKMEVPLEAPGAGRVLAIAAAVGEVAEEGAGLIEFEPADESAVSGARGAGGTIARPADAPAPAPAAERAGLVRLRERRALTQDEARPEAVARRHASGQRMARENIAALLDAGSGGKRSTAVSTFTRTCRLTCWRCGTGKT